MGDLIFGKVPFQEVGFHLPQNSRLVGHPRHTVRRTKDLCFTLSRFIHVHPVYREACFRFLIDRCKVRLLNAQALSAY